MPDTAIAVGHALFLWWFGTGAVLWLDGLPRRATPWTVAGATVAAALAVAVLAATAGGTSLGAAHAAFAAAVVVWGWNEILFLTGVVTGPRRGLDPGGRGWVRFRNAAETILYHEIALVLTAGLIALVLVGAENQVGLWTFLTLWAMRLSTKLNVFLGVRNLGEAFLPDHLAYLASYFRRAPMNRLLPWSLAGSTLLLAALVVAAVAPDARPHETAGLSLVATLVALAILEHGFLVLPLDSAGLWRWGFKSRAIDAQTPPPAARQSPRRSR